jgi:hypothetical protein
LRAEVAGLLQCFTSRHLLTWLGAFSAIGRVAIAYASYDIVCVMGGGVVLPAWRRICFMMDVDPAKPGHPTLIPDADL